MSSTDPSSRRTAAAPRRAFTLMEAAVSIALSTILVVVVGAALTNSISATERGADANARARTASDALDQVRADLALATSFHERSAHAVEFTIPDRYAQGYSPIVRYQWSGVKGDPLQKSFDGSEFAPVLADIRDLNFAYLIRPAPVSVEGAELTLRSCDQPAGTSLTQFEVTKDNYAAQYVYPTLPAGTVSWSIVRVRYRAMRTGGSGNYGVQIRTADATKTPTTTVLAEAVSSVNALATSLAWIDMPIGPVTGLDPTQGVCIVILGKSGSGGDKLEVQAVKGSGGNSNMPANTHWLTWDGSSGGSWSGWDDTTDMRFTLFGKATTRLEQPPQ